MSEHSTTTALPPPALEAELRALMARAVREVRETNPLAPSITNTVTQSFVANAQLAVGGSAAMVYLPDEGECVAALGGAVYINLGTLHARLRADGSRHGARLRGRGHALGARPGGRGHRQPAHPAHRGCARESRRPFCAATPRRSSPWPTCGGLADDSVDGASGDGPRGVDSTDSVDAAERAAVACARFTGGAVAVSGATDLVTDGVQVARLSGGSSLMTCITGSGCSLGGVCAVYACVADPFVAALTATAAYNLAGLRAAETCNGSGQLPSRLPQCPLQPHHRRSD